MEHKRSEKVIWSGVQCRNPDCREDFPVSVNSDLLVQHIGPDVTEGKVIEACSEIANRLSGAFTTMAALQGAATRSESGAIDIDPLLQHCPYCGRFYLYLYSDFFITSEDVPELPE